MSADDLSGAVWWVSSRSGGNEDTCVKVAAAPTERLIAARDSTDCSGPVLTFTHHEWAAFLTAINSGSLSA